MISNLRFPILARLRRVKFQSSFVNRQFYPPDVRRARIPLRGLTLIELVVSIAVTTILMLAIGSAMLVATKAMPEANGPANQIIVASEVAEQLAAELQYAVSVNSRSEKMIEFTVADRDTDEVPETIRYEWSGTPGAPLTRQYNGASVVEVLASVQEFDLSYDLETISKQITPENESPETLLSSYWSLFYLADYSINNSQWYGQYFFPSLPADTISWKVTRVEFYARVHGAAKGECRVQLQLPSAGKFPSGVVLEQKTLLESTLLDTYSKQQFDFSSVSNLSPDKGLCLVFKWIFDADACDIRGRYTGAGTPDSHVVKSTNAGASWISLDNHSLLYWVYGTVTTAGEPQIQQTYFLRKVNIKLRTGNDNQSSVYTAAEILNKPEVTQ